MDTGSSQAVVVTGVYGTGKTAVIEEMAAILEAAEVPFAAIDLDWLVWANIPDGHGPAGDRLLLANLAAVLANYRDAGMTRYLLAGAFDTQGQLEGLRRVLDMPMRVVRLTVPMETIERRLRADPTSGRQDDLAQARRDVATGTGGELGELGDLTVDNDRPIRDAAIEILDWLGWP
jgi:hypothetical protein